VFDCEVTTSSQGEGFVLGTGVVITDVGKRHLGSVLGKLMKF